MTACRAPVEEPSRGNPGGDCLADAVTAIPLGDTDRALPVCAVHAARYEGRVELDPDA